MPTTYRFGQGAAIGRGVPLIALLLSLAAATGWPQELNEVELGMTAGRVYAFESFAGPPSVVESVEEIVGIGEVLARTLNASGGRGDYFGKYRVIRAFDPSETSLLSADIVVLGTDARVNDIRNVQRIVAGYLVAAFGYTPAQADRLAGLVTVYNAAYRGDIAALSRKYTSLVMSNLTAENAGIALSYSEWPGRTRLVIPLGRTAGGQAGSAQAPGPAGAVAVRGAGSSGSAGPQAGGTAQASPGRGALTQTPASAAQGGGSGSGTSTAPAGGAAAPSTASPGSAATPAAAPGGGTSAAPQPSASAPSGEGTAAPEGSSPSQGPSATETAEFATLEFPGFVIRGGSRLSVRFVVRSSSRQPLEVQLLSIRRNDGTELLERPVSARVPPQGSRPIRAAIVLPDTTPLGRQSMPVQLGLSGRLPVSPSSGVLEIDYTGQAGLPGFSSRGPGWIILIAVLLLAALALLALLGARILRAGLRPAWARAVYLAAREGYPLVEMVVIMQNRHIGLRNVRYMRPGSSATVGGGRSAFLVYFVPVPPRMAYLRYDGRKYTFVPVKADLFPDLAGPVQDCLGKEIPALSPRGYRFTIVFRRFLSPLDEINRLMRSVRTLPSGRLPPRGTGPAPATSRRRPG